MIYAVIPLRQSFLKFATVISGAETFEAVDDNRFVLFFYFFLDFFYNCLGFACYNKGNNEPVNSLSS